MASPGTVICDLDGVVYLGETPIPGSGHALNDLDGAGYQILFVTNNATRTRYDAAAKIERVVGYPAEPDQVISSAMAGAHLVGDTRVLLVGAAGSRPILDEIGATLVTTAAEADAVLVGLDVELDYSELTEATRALVAGARFVATNTDPTFPLPDGPAPGAGAIVALLETTSERKAEVAGKPHPPIRQLIRERLVGGPVYVVGDRTTTDLAMGRAEGWHTVLVQTGIDREGDADWVVTDLAEFARRLSG